MSEDKITSIAELKKRVESIKQLAAPNSPGCVTCLNMILDWFNKFEASVKDELGSPSPPEITEYTKNDAYANGYFRALRRVLGEEPRR